MPSALSSSTPPVPAPSAATPDAVRAEGASGWLLPVSQGVRRRALRQGRRWSARLVIAGGLLVPLLQPHSAFAAPIFAPPQSNPFDLEDVGFDSSPTLADLDGDGDLDALIGATDGSLVYQENTGSALAPAFAAPQSNPFALQDVGRFSSPTLADLDGDGDLDALIGEQFGSLLYQENTGSALAPAFALPQSNPFALQDVGDLSSPTLADLDGDGDLDALIGERDSSLVYQENTGSALAPAFAAPQSNPFGLQAVGFYNSPTLADLDGDGDLDALIGAENGNLVYQANTGSALAPAFAAPQSNLFGLQDVGDFSSPTLADLDGDGDLDALIGELYGSLVYQENIAPPSAVTLAAFTAEGAETSIVVRWETASEMDNVGFRLLRAASPDGTPTPLTELIPAEAPGSSAGAAYQWLDSTAQAGVTYWYWLDDVATDGATTRHGPVSAQLVTPTAVTLGLLASSPAAPPAPLGGLAALLGALGLAGWWQRRCR